MASKTVYPGMQQSSGSNPNFNGAQPSHPAFSQQSNNAEEKRPILGFVFSVSRTCFGEYWPLYEGRNDIGRGKNNQVVLKETSVSENHAFIVIRNIMNGGVSQGIFVYVQDSGSTYGTMVNGETLNFSPRECHHGDIITVGANYELYLMLVDPAQLGLKEKEGFKPAEPAMPKINVGGFVQGQSGVFTGGQHKGTIPGEGFGNQAISQPQQSFQPDFPTQQNQQASNPFDSRKATIYMPNKK